MGSIPGRIIPKTLKMVQAAISLGSLGTFGTGIKTVKLEVVITLSV